MTGVDVLVIGGTAAQIAQSAASVEVDGALCDGSILTCAADDPRPWAGSSADHVFFLRGGDQVLPGTGRRLATILPDTDLYIGAHRRRGPNAWDTVVPPPSLATVDDLAHIATDAPLELSGLVVRRSMLRRALRPAPGRPGGEVALLATLLPTARVHIDSSPSVDVLMRPEHLGAPDAVLEQLRGVLIGPLGRHAEAATRIRRRALATAYLDAPPDLARRWSADHWWGEGSTERSADEWLEILREVHWVAARAVEARHIAALGFDGVAAESPTDAQAALPPDVGELQMNIHSLNLMVQELTATVTWLHAEVLSRDLALTELRQRPAVDEHATGAPEPSVIVQVVREGTVVEHTPAVELARVIAVRSRNRVVRLLKGRPS